MPDQEVTPITARHREVEVCDLDTGIAMLESLYGDVRASVDGAFVWRARVDALGPIILTQETCSAAVSVDATAEMYVLGLSAKNPARVSVPEGSVEIAPGRSGALLSPGARFAWRNTATIQALTMRIDPGFLVSQLEALTGATVRGPLGFAPELPTGGGAGAFVERLCHFILDEIDRGTPLEHPVLLTSLHEALARALLTGQPHDHAYLLEKPPPSGRTVVRLVEEYVDAHAGEAIRVSDLAALTGAGVTSIDAAFLAHRGTTTAGFLRARRLDRARQMLLTELQIPVTRVAHSAGFLRPETFEARYVKAFRETPGETRRRGLVASPSSPGAGPRADLEARLALISQREREVCVRVARGMLNKQIAADLGISERMVREHRGRGMKKLEAESAVELVRLLIQLGG